LGEEKGGSGGGERLGTEGGGGRKDGISMRYRRDRGSWGGGIWNIGMQVKLKGIFYFFFSIYGIQYCFICRPSDSTVSEDAGIEPRTVAAL
jgi:hypothetical protein